MGLSLMELLKASGYDIQATCGGMALCATCHVEVLAGPALPEPGDDELDMLETLPVVHEGSPPELPDSPHAPHRRAGGAPGPDGRVAEAHQEANEYKQHRHAALVQHDGAFLLYQF